ncbi:MAG: histidinol dehydrogenase [Candidatus Neomarinimicrobiota bacterium]
MEIIEYPNPNQWNELIRRPASDSGKISASVAAILAAVRSGGDRKLREFTARFDGFDAPVRPVPVVEIQAASVSAGLAGAIDQARNNIERFHRPQIEKPLLVEVEAGVVCWRESRPIEKVGLYIPGGSAPLFSTLLMLGIPARLAGCREIVVCTPAGAGGRVPAVILYTARLLGLDKIFPLGGAQAIAALAYGTESVPRVDKIFGPGNQYVTAAKQLVQQDGVAIDMPAGPSEVLVLADESGDAEFIAADLLSQAEHGPDSQVLLVTDSFYLADRTRAEIWRQLEELPRQSTARQSLAHSRIIVLGDLAAALEFSNRYAPEHLIIATADADQVALQVQNAGSVFIGNYSCESAGDYASGTNHTLPTDGWARSYSGLSVDSFVKKISFQRIEPAGLKNIGPAIEIMAAAEGLDAHRLAVTRRLRRINNV